ncbi:Hypothetical predicted protein [Mytilus galloprovincialis]|uniref:QRICH1-like domain-containing protein n=1 Tax=Mytilus galloprovincialis TaxID=29158 RepID=A0A8B6FNQ0_MYTGA|nr:Hypothetical predicted protein [Mytilus galloprovincialis]
MDKTELSTSLQYFIAEAKKKDGGTYPSNSIYDLFSSIQGYIRHQKSSSINFFTDPEFLRARQVLDAVMKERATEGLGANTRKQADVISVDEETSLYDKGILGVDNPQQLLDTLLYLCGHRCNAVRVYKRTSADQQIQASNILYGLGPSDGSKKAKPSAARMHQLAVLRLNVQQTSDKKTVTCNFSL